MFKKFREFQNGQQMSAMRPSTVLFSMTYRFVIQKKPESAHAPKYLFRTISVSGANFNYDYENPQNKVLRHGMLYNTLLKMYINTLETPINDTLLQKDPKSDKRPKIDFIEYNNLPECYQEAFVPYDEDYYVLNVNKTRNDIVIKTDKQNNATVINLLKRAKMLLPVIYKTETKSDKSKEVPAFAMNPLSAYFVSDEQMSTLLELHKIFMQLATITIPAKTNLTPEASSKNMALYNEYLANRAAHVK